MKIQLRVLQLADGVSQGGHKSERGDMKGNINWHKVMMT